MGKTVRVRIAVAVNGEGEWDAAGMSGDDDEMSLCTAGCNLPGFLSHYWLEADLTTPEIPEAKTIAATVITAKD